MKVDIIGPFPPPYGGISIHIERLSQNLERLGIEYTIYDTSGIPKKDVKNIICVNNMKKWLFSYFFHVCTDIIHLNAGSTWKLRIYFGLIMSLLRKRRVVISVHGNDVTWPYAINFQRSSDSTLKGKFITKLVIRAHKHTSFVIADNSELKDLLVSLGVKPNKVDVVSAFIPPVVKEEDYPKVPQYIWDFMKIHEPVISANAFQISFYNGIDLYGLDMIVELVDKLSEKYPQIGIVFCLPNVGDEDYFSEINRRIEEKSLTENILFITKPLPEVYPIWEKSDIFVRPTVTDGDPLSVREALSLKTPVVTSDACPRPDGVVLFKNRDLDDFVNAVQKIWGNYDEYKKKLESMEVESGINKILKIYNKLWAERA